MIIDKYIYKVKNTLIITKVYLGHDSVVRTNFSINKYIYCMIKI